MRISFISLLLLMAVLPADCQLLSGTVKNESGFSASLINVSFKNKKNKVKTKRDGTFKIFATSLPDTLMFSGPGIEPYEVIITEENIKDPKFEVVLLDERTAPSYATKSAPFDFASREEAMRFHGKTATPKMTLRKKDFVVAEELKPDETVSAKSKLITAAEVNDFQKWNLWEDYNEAEFEMASKYYGIAPRNRFCVQLKNASNKAAVGVPVQLIDEKSGNVLWEAISDNTGKAELWSNLFTQDSADYDLAILCNGKKVAAPIPFQKGINEISLEKNCNYSDLVEIAFMMDATSSMGSEMEFLKLDLEAVIRHTFAKLEGLDLRVGTVFYRDKRDAYVTDKLNFQTDLLKVLNFIKLHKAQGGGDPPEAVDSAFHQIVHGLDWTENARTKMLFIITDAPPHKYAHSNMRTLMKAAAKKGIRIVPIACKGIDNTYEFLLRSLSLATNGTYLCLTNHSGIGGAHKEPITDEYKVELLNNAMQRLIKQFVHVESCEDETIKEAPKNALPMQNAAKDILDLKVFPNPTSGPLNINIKEKLEGLYLADFTGKLLEALPTESGDYELNLEQYPSGIYLLRYLTKDKQWGGKQVILQRD